MNPTNFLALAEVRPTTHNPDPCIKKITLLLAENLAYQWQVP